MLSQVEEMLPIYERRAKDSVAGRQFVEANACFYERRAEDRAVGKKNSEPSGRNAVFL
jgi:hypothetical protein